MNLGAPELINVGVLTGPGVGVCREAEPGVGVCREQEPGVGVCREHEPGVGVCKELPGEFINFSSVIVSGVWALLFRASVIVPKKFVVFSKIKNK